MERHMKAVNLGQTIGLIRRSSPCFDDTVDILVMCKSLSNSWQRNDTRPPWRSWHATLADESMFWPLWIRTRRDSSLRGECKIAKEKPQKGPQTGSPVQQYLTRTVLQGRRAFRVARLSLAHLKHSRCVSAPVLWSMTFVLFFFDWVINTKLTKSC